MKQIWMSLHAFLRLDIFIGIVDIIKFGLTFSHWTVIDGFVRSFSFVCAKKKKKKMLEIKSTFLCVAILVHETNKIDENMTEIEKREHKTFTCDTTLFSSFFWYFSFYYSPFISRRLLTSFQTNLFGLFFFFFFFALQFIFLLLVVVFLLLVICSFIFHCFALCGICCLFLLPPNGNWSFEQIFFITHLLLFVFFFLVCNMRATRDKSNIKMLYF